MGMQPHRSRHGVRRVTLGAGERTQGKPQRWFSDPIHKLDVKRFTVEIGKAKDQALLEVLTMLVGVRLWARFCHTRKWAVYLRSDSQAALWAAFKLRSPDPSINAVVREISLDLAEGEYEIDFLEHILGANNVYADSLSRFYQPGASRKIPEELAGAERDVSPKRTQVVGDGRGGRQSGRQRGYSRAEQRRSWSAMAWCICRYALGYEAGRSGARRPRTQPLRQTCRTGRELLLHLVGSRLQNFLEGKGKADPRGEVLAYGLQVSRVPVGVAYPQGAEEESRQGQGRSRQRDRKHYLQALFRGAQERTKFCGRKSKRFVHVGPARCTQAGSGGGCVQGDLLTLYVRRRLEEQARHCAHQLAGSAGRARRQAVPKWQDLRSYWSRTRDMDTHGSQRRDPQLPSEVDEEYPEGLCEAVAKTIVGEYAEAITNGYVYRWGFTEVFFGPNALLICAAEHAAKEFFFGQRFVGCAYC